MANLFNLIYGILSFILGLNKNKYINLSEYKYPSPKDKEYTYIPIIETTDLHGYGFQREIESKSNFSYGGASLLSSYIEAIRNEWGDNFLYLDAGDKYKGGVESTISNGTIMTEIFNHENLDASAIGNHEFDNGVSFFEKQMESSKTFWITTNIRNANNNSTDAFNVKKYLQKKIIIKKGIKIGILGYTPLFTYYAENDVLKKLNFLKMKDTILDESKRLREQDKVNSVILIIHYGIECYSDSQDIGIYNISHSQNNQNCNINNNELYDFLMNSPIGTIDAVFGGHVHYPGHHFFNGIPVIHSKDRGVHFHIAYLPFKDNKLVREKIQVEGPIPLCDKISNSTKKCSYDNKDEEMYPFTFHNSIIRYNEKIERNVLNKYNKEMLKYKKFICNNNDAILERVKEESVIGNLETDAIRIKTKADFSIINNGAFRTIWYPGKIYLKDIYDMNPFQSNIVTFEMNGEEIYKAMNILQNGEKKYYAISGMKIYFKKVNGIFNIEKITLNNDQEIDRKKNYIIATTNFILGGGDDFKDVLKWYTPRNKKSFDLLIPIIEEYLINVKDIKKANYYDSDPSKRRLIFK